MSEPTDREATSDTPPTIPFPAPRESPADREARVAEIRHATANLDLRRLPPGLRESAAAVLRGWAEVYGVSTVRVARVDQAEEGGQT